MFRTTFVLATLAVAALAQPAAAQQARYCDGQLVANSFYSNVQSNGRTADVEYHGQFQNQDPQRRPVTATMLTIQRIGPFQVLRPVARFDLNPYEQKDITLLSLHTQNPGGTGAPPPSEVARQIRFVCNFR